MTRRSLLVGWLALATVALTLGLAGCGSDGQLGPNPRPAASDPWARVLGASPAGPAAQGADRPSGAESLSDSLITYTGLNTIDGAVGGSIAFGRYVLTFPAKAFKGTVTIRVETDNSGLVDCKLYPEGMKFNGTVNLTMSLSGTTQDTAESTIYWYDPNAGTWVDQKGVYDPTTHTVTGKLKHFSEYRGGRSGW